MAVSTGELNCEFSDFPICPHINFPNVANLKTDLSILKARLALTIVKDQTFSMDLHGVIRLEFVRSWGGGKRKPCFQLCHEFAMRCMKLTKLILYLSSSWSTWSSFSVI